MKTEGLRDAEPDRHTRRRVEREQKRQTDVRTCIYCGLEFVPRDRRGAKRRKVCYAPECERRREADRQHRKHRARKRREAAAAIKEKT